MAKSISWSQPDWAHISLDEDITKGRPKNKQFNSIQVYLYSAFQRRKCCKAALQKCKFVHYILLLFFL